MQGGFSMKKTTKNEDLNFILSYRQAKEKSRELLEFERVFEKEINHASEFGFKNLKTGKYEISVEKQDDLFLNRVEEYLKILSVDEESKNMYEKAKEIFADSDTMIKVGFSEKGCEGFSIYFRTPCTIGTIKQISPNINLDMFKKYSEAFNKKIFFIGLDLMPVALIPYILIHPDYPQELPDLLAEFMDIKPEKRDIFIEDVKLLMNYASDDIFISFTPDGEKIKADFQNIPLPLGFKITKDLDFNAEDFKTAVEFSLFSENKNFYYFSLSSQNKKLGTKYYFKNYYFANGDETLVYAEKLKKMKILL